MRTIKFRYFDKKNKRMHDSLSVARYTLAALLDNEDGDSYSPWMQFTGQYDKNEAEIYEGDILKFTIASGDVLVGVVDFDEYASCFDFVYGRQRFGFEEEYGMKVIGNIYENPELLEASE